jgi:hypothetical protein
MPDRCVATIVKNARETIHIHLGAFNGHELVHVRAWVMSNNGEPIPTRAGIAFKVALLPDIIAALERAWMEASR